MGLDAMILVFWLLNFKPAFSLSSFTFIKRLFSSSSVQFSWAQFSSILLGHVQLFVTPYTARLPCPSPIPRACSNSCPLSQQCHPSISSSVVLFSSRLQSFRASGSLPMNQFVTSGDQSTEALASASVLPMNIQDWSPLGWTGWISLQFKGLSRVFSNSIKGISSSVLSFLYSPTLTSIHDHWKTIALVRQTFVGKVVSLLFNMLSRVVIAFPPRSKHLLISWLQSPSAVILEPPKVKVFHCFHYFSIYLPWSDGTRCHDLSFLNVEF